jgi:hypothetical protein
MMRWWIGFLLLLNALTLAWHWDVFGRWGWGPNAQSEPERLQQQIKPEAMTVTVPGRDGPLPSAPPVAAPEPTDKPALGSETSPSLPQTADAAVVRATAVATPVITIPAAVVPVKPASN